MHHRIVSISAIPALLYGAVLAAQTPKSDLNPSSWGVVYDVPATRRVIVRADVPYARLGDRSLKLDLYLPPGLKPGERRPAVVFINAIGGDTLDPVRRWGIYRTWPRLLAAHGLIGIMMDADGGRIPESIGGVFKFLRKDGPRFNVDPGRLGIYAASANVTGAHAYLTSDSVDPGIKAAVLYYGGVPEGRLRPDLPVLFVVAQSDAARMGPRLTGLWQRVVDSALPWTLVFGRGMPHAFDAFSETDDARHLIQQTIGFWRSNLEPLPPPPPPAEGRRILAALFGNDSPRAADLLKDYVKRHPAEGEAFMHLGRVLSDLNRFAEADTAYTRSYALDSSNPGAVYGLGRVRIGQQRWAEGEYLLVRSAGMGMENSLTHGLIGWARLHLGKNAEAVASYEHALELGIPPGRNTLGLAWYNLACGYARLGRKDDALKALTHAAEQGLNERATYEQDEDLAGLRSDPRFQSLVSSLPATPAPR